jgi:TolB-like protein/Flp pilus assembly protein TadD
MKSCPKCQSIYPETQNYCRTDGAALFSDSTPTAILTTGKLNDAALAATPAAKSSKRQSKSKAIASIAVLPFINETAEANNEYLSDGFSDSLINSLSQLPKLRVMARGTVFRYKGQAIDLQDVGRDLGVRAVLTGRIAQQGDRLIINTELLDVVDGAQIWGERYNRKLTDIFEVQEEIAAEISEKLRVKLNSADRKRINKRYTENFEAYQLYLKGRYYWLNTRTEEGIRRSIEHFNRAIEVDPSYALAYTGLSDSYVVLGLSYVVPSIDILPGAKAAAIKALAIDDTLAEAHVSLSIISLFIEWDWASYERENKRAIALNPNYATAYYTYAQYLMAMGQFDEAIQEAKRARELDPLALDINAHVGRSYYYARNYEEAIKQFRKVIEIDPEYFQAHRRLGMALLQQKQYEEALAAIKKARALAVNSVEELAYLGYALAVSGQSQEALTIISQLEVESTSRYISPYLMALIYVGLGENDLAFEWLEKAFEARAVNLIWLNVEPIFDSLRVDARYPPLLRRIGIAS